MSERKRNSYITKDFYKYYIKSISGNEDAYFVDSKLYSKILFESCKMMMNAIYNGESFHIPCNIGELYIVKKKPAFNKKSLSVDFAESKKIGKLVFYTNDHSGGFKYRFHWDKKRSIIRNKFRYQMIFTRANKRFLAKIIKNKEHDYIEI